MEGRSVQPFDGFRTLHTRVKRGGFGRSVVATVVATADAA